MCAAQQTEELGPWRLEWQDNYAKLRGFGTEVTIEPSQNDPSLTVVNVTKVNPATSEIAVQIFEDGDLCREF